MDLILTDVELNIAIKCQRNKQKEIKLQIKEYYLNQRKENEGM